MRFFSPGFQIEGVFFDLLDDVFLHHLTLKAAQTHFQSIHLHEA